MRAAGIVVLLATTSAHADDPRDVFGIPKKPVEAPIDCTTGADFGCATATDPFTDHSPLALASWLPARYLRSLPVADATHDQVATYALGAGRDETGPIFGGATGLENRWSVEGAPIESLRTGGVETRIPLIFLDGILVTAGGFAARDRASTGGTIDARLRRGGDHHEVEAEAWATWSARGRHPAIANDTYQVRRGTVDPHWGASAAVVATGPLGPLLGGAGWYAAGIAPSLEIDDFRWSAASLVDRDQDGIPDGIPGVPALQLIERNAQQPVTYAVPAMARAGLDRGPHHVELSLLASASSSYFMLYNATVQAAGIDTHSFIGDAVATYRGEWHDTHVRAQLAWHRAMRTQSARDPAAANIPQLFSEYVPTVVPEDPALAGACDDTSAGDPYPMIPNCPVPGSSFASGGAGKLVDTTSDRPSLTADVARRYGNHVARAGATGEDSRYVSESRFTGGQQLSSLFPGEVAVREFLAKNQPCDADPAKPCATVATSELAYRTRYSAAYLEDTWHPTKDLAFDGGLRWELMWVGTRLHFSNEWAPRLGMTWDPLGGGRSRVWVGAGRSFAVLPAGMGPTVIAVDRTVDNITSPFGPARAINTGAPITIISGVKPVAQDELVAGAEVALARAVRARAWAQGRWLVRGLGLSADGLDNPGRGNPDAPPASRNTALVALELQTAPTAHLALRAGYTYAVTVGSYVGPYDPREGVVLYASSEYETPGANLVGSLPTDLGHRFYLDAERRGQLGDVGWRVATRLTAGSGRPRDALIDGDDGLIYAIPRGAAGRDAVVTQANVRVAARWRGFDVTIDVFNAFDRRTPTYVDPIYARGALRPIQGGSYSDLVFLRSDGGQPAIRRPSYELGLGFQSPRAIVVGIHHDL